MKNALLVSFSAFLLATSGWTAADTDAPDKRTGVEHFTTRFGKTVTPENVWREYPRPTMVRRDWLNLNGHWDYAIIGTPQKRDNATLVNAEADPLLKVLPNPPSQWDGKILVPFAPEAPLSGVSRYIWPSQLLWYRKEVEIPADWKGRRVLLHFGAVDWHCVIWANGQKVGEHKGGYNPFSCDITEALKPQGPQQITLVVWDPSNAGDQANGKQTLTGGGKLVFASTTGIWQSVWLEPVSNTYIQRLVLTPDVDKGRLNAKVELSDAAPGCELVLQAFEGQQLVASATTAASASLAKLAIPKPKLWSPASPFLYDLRVSLRQKGVEKGTPLDEVTSYFGMRKLEVSRDAAGLPRVKLNGEPIFLFGPLDSCVWPESIITPPSDEAARFEVQYLRDIGCNMDRVHMTVHPERWYYWADKLGLVVWQDFVRKIPFSTPTESSTAIQWEAEQREMMESLRNHPSLMMWMVFNESWGQYDTERITRWAMELDPSRLVCNASGWNDSQTGHIFDVHDYSYYSSIAKPGQLSDRAMSLGECGGFEVIVPGHTLRNYSAAHKFDPAGDDNRPTFLDAQSMLKPYEDWVERLHLLRSLGLNSAVYTQLYDTGGECNGWLTYDREMSKLPVKTLAEIHSRLYRPLSEMRPILPLLVEGTGTSRVKTTRPEAGWEQADFNDQTWQERKIPIGATGPKGERVPRLYVRRAFDLKETSGKVALQVSGWGTFNVWLNGQRIQSLSNTRTESYTPVSLVMIPPQMLASSGRNVMAVEIQLSSSKKQINGADPLADGYDFALVEVCDPADGK